MKAVNQNLLNNVNGAFQFLTEELSKPQEDVVAISVCGSTRSAIEDILKLYLESQGINTMQLVSMDEMIKQCIDQDQNFKNFSFASIQCHCMPASGNEVFCISDKNHHACYKLLTELKSYIFSELKIED